jgi:hypothetical protein
MAEMIAARSTRAILLGLLLTGVVGFWALPLAAAYAVFLIPMSLIPYVGGSWYFGFVSLVAGGILGVVVGGTSYALFSKTQLAWHIAAAIPPAVVYLAFAVYARGGLVAGPGWWTPLSDAAAFVAAFIGIGLLLAGKQRVHAI